MTVAFKKQIMEYILDYLRDNFGRDQDMDTFAMNITEDINNTGSVYCNWKMAKEEICKFWDDAEEYDRWHKDTFGDQPVYDVFEDTESFHVCMYIWGVEEMINACEYVSEHSDEIIQIDDKFIEIIEKQLEEQIYNY